MRITILLFISFIVIGYFVHCIIQLNRIIKENKTEVFYEGQKVAMPREYREVTGRDSIQITRFMGKWEAHFCYPNRESIWMVGKDSTRILIYTGYTDSTK